MTITADGKVVVTRPSGNIGSRSQAMALKIFGNLNETVFIPKGKGRTAADTNYDNTMWKDASGNPIKTESYNHAEAKGFQEVLSRWGMDALSGARQATTKPSCLKCEDMYKSWNSYYENRGMQGIKNVSGFKKTKK